MRTCWTLGLAVMVLSACTRDNPAFDGGEGGKDDEGTTIGPGATSLGTTSLGTTVGEDSVEGDGSETTSTSAADTTIGVSGTDNGSTDKPGSSGPVDTGEICVPEPPPPFGIAANPSFESIFGGDCPPQESLTIFVDPQNVSNDLEGTLCNDMCTCGDSPISLTFDVPLPALGNGCFNLEVRFHPTTCDVAAYMLVGSEGPLTVVSNVLIPSMLPFSVALAENPTTPCGEGCMPASGEYAVVFSADSTVIPPGVAPVPILGGNYEAFNPGSGIDGDCGEVARWYILPSP